MKKTLGMLTIGSRKEFYISKGIFSSTHYFSVAMFIQAKHYYDDAGHCLFSVQHCMLLWDQFCVVTARNLQHPFANRLGNLHFSLATYGYHGLID